MKTATLDVGGMLSVLDYQCIEKQLRRLHGVLRADASIGSNSVTVAYEEAVTNITVLKDKINQCGFHCTGEIMPKHVCESNKKHARNYVRPAVPGGSAEATPATVAPAVQEHHADQAHGLAAAGSDGGKGDADGRRDRP